MGVTSAAVRMSEPDPSKLASISVPAEGGKESEDATGPPPVQQHAETKEEKDKTQLVRSSLVGCRNVAGPDAV